MPLSSPRSPQKMGFMPLANPQSNTYSPEADIPLSNVRSHASSTGARRRNQGTFDTGKMSDSNDEKRGLFSSRGPAGRRKAKKDLARSGTAGSDDFSLNFMGRIYNKVISFGVIARYLLYVVPVALLLAVPIVILPITGNKDSIRVGGFITTAQNVQVAGPSLFMLFVWIEISWLSLWVGKIVAHLMPPVFIFFCGVISSGTRKYATVLKALEIPLSLFFWGLASWLTFKYLFNGDGVFQWVSILTNILGALFVSSAVFLGEKAIVQLISITYHQRSFANRISDSKHDVYLLGLMYDASRMLFPMYCPEFADEDYIINDSIDMMLGGQKGHARGGSVTPMRLIGEVGRFGDKITSVFGNFASEITGKQVFNPNSAHSIVVEALEKLRTSEALGRRIWMSFAVEGKESLSPDDIVEVLGPAHKDEAEECFAAMDTDGNGDISLDEMIRKVVEIGKERKDIANSMKDISQALAVFDNVLLFLVLLIVIFIFLAFFQSSFITTLATAGTALLSLSFVFAVTTQEFLGSCIFLFVKHPYDVGDRVDIVGPEKEQLVVERISLLYTVFKRIDKMQVVQVPNIVLNNLWIENVTRSKAMKEVIDLNVSYDTSFEDIELLRLEMEKFVRSPDNSRDFQPDIAVGVAGVGDLDRLQLKIAIKHKSNWHNEIIRSTRRSKFMCALAMALRRVPIYAPGGGSEALGGPNNPSYSVAVSDDFAAASRDKAAHAKEALRMASPLKPAKSVISSKSTTKKVEERAVADLNTRPNPAAVAADDRIGTLDDQVGSRDDWTGSREETLGSRDQSVDGNARAADIETIRQELISTRESRRGRRKAGDGIPPTPLGEGTPAVQVTRFDTRGGVRSFDVESQTGTSTAFSNTPLAVPYGGGGATPVPPGSAAVAGYSVFPPSGRAYSPPSSSSNNMAGMQGAPHPLQSAPTGAGGRPRGPSVSRPLPEPGQGQGGQF